MATPLEEIAKSPLPEAAQLVIADEHPAMHHDLVVCPTLTDGAFARLYPQLGATDRGRLLRQTRLTAARIETVLTHETKRGPLNVLVDLIEEDLTDDHWMALASTEPLDPVIAARIVNTPCAPSAARAVAVRSSGVTATLRWHADNAHTGTVDTASTVAAVNAALENRDELDGDAAVLLARITRECPEVTELLLGDPLGRTALAMLPYDPKVHDALLSADDPKEKHLALTAQLDLPERLREYAWQLAADDSPAREVRLVAEGHIPPSRLQGSDGVPLDQLDDPNLLDAVVWNLDRMSGLPHLLRLVQLAGNPHLDPLQATHVLRRVREARTDSTAYLCQEAARRMSQNFPHAPELIGQHAWERIHQPPRATQPWRKRRAQYARRDRNSRTWGWSEPEELADTVLKEFRDNWSVCAAHGRDDTGAVWDWVLKLVKAGFRPRTVGELFAPARLFADEPDTAALEIAETLLDPDCDPAKVLDAARAALTTA